MPDDGHSLSSRILLAAVPVIVAFSLQQYCRAQSTTSGSPGTSAAVHADDEWRKQVRAHLADTETRLKIGGYSLAQEVYIGEAKEDDEIPLLVTMTQGDYAVAAVCDNDCTDIDLEVSLSDETVESDLRVNNRPLIQFHAPERASYKIETSMETCTKPPCRYGVAIFKKSGG